MKTAKKNGLATAAVLGAILMAGSAVAPAMADDGFTRMARTEKPKRPKHVLLLSVDGLHQKDLDLYVQNHPTSALASLVNHGTSYTHAQTPVPSDSFPGMVGQLTGGNPGTTGSTTTTRSTGPCCRPARPTARTPPQAPGLHRSGEQEPEGTRRRPRPPRASGKHHDYDGPPRHAPGPAALPVDPATCKPVYPHQYLKVNTVFEVAKSAGLTTAWSDKHPAYEILNGPSARA